MDLTIVLRTCGSSGVLLNSTPRISGTDRRTLVLKCVKSLVESINNVTDNITMKLWVLDDHSDQDFLNKINHIVSDCKISYDVVSLPDRPDDFAFPYNWSAYEQFRYGRDIADGLVYFVEDDYLHSKDAIQSMIQAYVMFRNLTDLTPVALYPYDSTHNYKQMSEPCRLFYAPDQRRMWRTTSKTANTIFMHSDQVRQYWQLFEVLAKQYGNGANEDITINRIWNNGVIQSGPVCLFSPIPSVAVHVSFDEPVLLTDQLNDWHIRYDEIIL